MCGPRPGPPEGFHTGRKDVVSKRQGRGSSSRLPPRSPGVVQASPRASSSYAGSQSPGPERLPPHPPDTHGRSEHPRVLHTPAKVRALTRSHGPPSPQPPHPAPRHSHTRVTGRVAHSAPRSHTLPRPPRGPGSPGPSPKPPDPGLTHSEMCRKMSGPPSAGVMKPWPLDRQKHLQTPLYTGP